MKGILSLVEDGFLSDLRFNKSIILKSTLADIEGYAKDFDLDYDLVTEISQAKEYITNIHNRNSRRLVMTYKVLSSLDKRDVRILRKIIKKGVTHFILCVE